MSDDAIEDYVSKKKRESGSQRQLRLQDQVRDRRLYHTVTVCGDHNGKGAPSTSGDGLATSVRRMMPTPVASDKNMGIMNRSKKGGLKLSELTEGYQTPTVGDTKYSISGHSQASKCLGAMAAREGVADSSSARLNPDWVEWLMGWPVGWTDIASPCDDEQISWEHDPADDSSIPRITERRTHRSKRIVCLGNGQVPQAMVLAYNTLRRM